MYVRRVKFRVGVEGDGGDRAIAGDAGDRCIVIRMQRKMWTRNVIWSAIWMRGRLSESAAVARDNASRSAGATGDSGGLNDRAGDIWEPLLALADLAGGDWPGKARQAAVALNAAHRRAVQLGPCCWIY